MKTKEFLKKMIGVLCVGALVSMPMTAVAADKGDVVGDWTGNWSWASVSFYENGEAKDSYNTKPYMMQSGSLTVTDVNTGVTETVDYDLWRGYQIKDVPNDKSANAVLYKIIEPRKKMIAWNVYKEENDSEWKTYGPAVITLNKKEDTGSDRKCEHSYEWTIITDPTETEDGVSAYICKSCGDIKARQPISIDVAIRKNLLESIKNAEAGTTVTFDNEAWLCYPQYVLDALKEKGSVSLKTDFTYEGINYSFTIPAGSDYTNLEQADFYGFMYLLGAFDGTIVE